MEKEEIIRGLKDLLTILEGATPPRVVYEQADIVAAFINFSLLCRKVRQGKKEIRNLIKKLEE